MTKEQLSDYVAINFFAQRHHQAQIYVDKVSLSPPASAPLLMTLHCQPSLHCCSRHYHMSLKRPVAIKSCHHFMRCIDLHQQISLFEPNISRTSMLTLKLFMLLCKCQSVSNTMPCSIPDPIKLQ